MTLKNFLTSMLCMLISGWAFAQPDFNLEEIKTKFKGEKLVVFEDRETIHIKTGSKGLEITSSHKLQILYLDIKGVSTPGDRVPYDDHFYSITDIKACAWLPEAGKLKKVPVKTFNDVQSVDGESFYDSRRYKSFSYGTVPNGGLTEVEYTYDIHDPVSLGAHSFQFGVPVVNSILEVIVEGDMEVDFAVFGDQGFVKKSVTEKGKVKTYVFEGKNTPALKDFSYMSSSDSYRSHIFPYIKNYTIKGATTKLLGSKADLYNYNYNFIKDLDHTPSAEMKLVVDSIKKVQTAEEDIVKSIFYWVQDNIRYIAFEDGLGGFVPRPANMVCDKRYGDCKDMANLIKTMMDYAEVPGYLCWIGTRSKGYTYEELPLPYCDNHMIAVYKKGDEFVFLDATSKQHKYGLPSQGIQGKQAMVALGEGKFETPFVPVVPASVNISADSSKITLEGKSLKVKGALRVDGFIRSGIASEVEYGGTQNEKKIWEDVVDRGNNKCRLDAYHVIQIKDRDQPLHVQYELTIDDYVRFIENEVYINFNLDKGITALKPDTADRPIGVEYNSTVNEITYTAMSIPEGYSLKKLPENLSINTDLYNIEFNYSFVNNQIQLMRVFELKTITMTHDQMIQWVKDLDRVTQAYQQVVVFQQKNNAK